MLRKETKAAGIEAMSTEKREWFRRHATGIRTAADGVAATGLMAVQSLVVAKTGSVPEAVMESLLIGTAQMGLATDAIDRWFHRNEQSSEKGLVDPFEGVHIGGNEVSASPKRARVFINTGARIIYNAGYVAGISTLAVVTAALARARNLPEAIVTGAAEVILLSDLDRRKKILGRLDENE